MKSNKNNILINEKNEQKENIENNININNDINNNDFSNIKILKEYESNPNKDILKYSEKNQSKAKYTETIEVIYEEIPYKLNISLKFDNNIYIELISKEGHIPYSYRAILDEKKFHKLNSIFEEINSIQKIYNKIINLLKKKRVSLIKDKKEEIFFLILNITIIDEDQKIFIPLNINDNIQISTINYLLRETEFIKNEFDKKEINNKIQKENIELNLIKNENKYYYNIIDEMYKKFENANDKKNKRNINEKTINIISKEIMAQNEENKELINRINMIENEFNLLKNKIKCKFTQKNIILYLDFNQKNPYYLFHFGIKNTGNLIISSKYDKLYFNIKEEESKDIISFFNSSEKYINFQNQSQCLSPNEKINICKKLTFKNLKPNSKYEILINIYSSCHGIISEEPIKINIFTNEYKDKDFISLLKNDELKFDISNQKVIFEYLEEINYIQDNNKNDFIKNKKRYKINTYLYNNKKGMIENKEEDLEDTYNYVIINTEYINNIKIKLYKKYEYSKKIEKEKIEDIIFTCAGNYLAICKVIENYQK